jgi:nicotinamide-nucleotide adenylyltransferase
LENRILPTDGFDRNHLFARVGMIARWRPVHRGHAPVLRALCDRAEHALIGIGSANEYSLRNPFTLEETMDMIRLVLAGRSNYRLIAVPDLHDGPRWQRMVLDLFGPLDLFVTENQYVASLLSADYNLIRPVQFISEAEKIAVDGSLVRREMACGDGWRALVPEEVAAYIDAHHLDDRFRREFGLLTLALETIIVDGEKLDEQSYTG